MRASTGPSTAHFRAAVFRCPIRWMISTEAEGLSTAIRVIHGPRTSRFSIAEEPPSSKAIASRKGSSSLACRCHLSRAWQATGC